MARVPWSVIVGFVVPLVLIVVNLVTHIGGLLFLIILFCWVGLAVFLMTPEDKSVT